ncbi:hypothetical protein [Streptomyces chrestomyceticus]|uniref:hypothetical protein n=1 Tax=Streptomyces chrestomyceticus TaxID=68185 RepID=UPI0033D6AF5E
MTTTGPAAGAAAGSSTVPAAQLHERTRYDLRLRRQVFDGSPVLHVPRGSEEFWTWYARTMRFGDAPDSYELVPVDGVPPYPEPERPAVLWYSGGVESTYSLHVLRERGVEPDLLHIEDFDVFEGPDRKVGQIHFLCAAIASGLGYREIYLGMERDDFLLTPTKKAQRYTERHPVFAQWWSSYQPSHMTRTVCGHLEKEEIIRWLVERKIPITGTCDHYDDGTWCGECYKCFEAFYFAKAVGLDLGIRPVRASFEEYYSEYQRYLDSRFTDNFNNSYHRFSRLQMQYGMPIDLDRDCVR